MGNLDGGLESMYFTGDLRMIFLHWFLFPKEIPVQKLSCCSWDQRSKYADLAGARWPSACLEEQNHLRRTPASGAEQSTSPSGVLQ